MHIKKQGARVSERLFKKITPFKGPCPHQGWDASSSHFCTHHSGHPPPDWRRCPFSASASGTGAGCRLAPEAAQTSGTAWLGSPPLPCTPSGWGWGAVAVHTSPLWQDVDEARKVAKMRKTEQTINILSELVPSPRVHGPLPQMSVGQDSRLPWTFAPDASRPRQWLPFCFAFL